MAQSTYNQIRPTFCTKYKKHITKPIKNPNLFQNILIILSSTKFQTDRLQHRININKPSLTLIRNYKSRIKMMLTFLPSLSIRIAPFLAENSPCKVTYSGSTQHSARIPHTTLIEQNRIGDHIDPCHCYYSKNNRFPKIDLEMCREREGEGYEQGIWRRAEYFLVQQLPHGGAQSFGNMAPPPPPPSPPRRRRRGGS